MKEFARGNLPIDPMARDSGPIPNEDGGHHRRREFLNGQAHEKIVPLGRHAVPELVNWLDHGDRHIRFIAYYALIELTGTGKDFREPYSLQDMIDSGELEKYKRICLEWYEEHKDK